MNMQHDVSRILHELEHKRIDPWGTHARHLANGIERSGVPALLGQVSDQLTGVESAVRSSSIEVTASLAALAAVNASGFQAVCGELGRQTETLNQIESVLANPLSTAAAERYRRGVRALHEGWFDDAITELNASIEQDPFQALTHYCLGLAYGALDHPDEAIPSFMSAIKYCGSDAALAPVGAGAALLAAQTAEASGRPEVARAAVTAGLERAPDCAELLLAHARQTGDQTALKSAFSLAPELALPAVAVGVHDADRVAQGVHDDSTGPVAAARSASQAANRLGMSITWPTAVPAAMTFHHQWRLGEAAALSELAARTAREVELVERQADSKLAAVKQFSIPATTYPWVIPLIFFLIGSGVFLNFVMSAPNDATSTAGAGVESEGEFLSLGGVIGTLGFLVAVASFFFLMGAIKAIQRNSRERWAATGRLMELKEAALVADGELQKARERSAIAREMSTALAQACPKRTLPLSSVSVGGGREVG